MAKEKLDWLKPHLWEIVLDPTGMAKQAIADFDGDNTICFGGSYDDGQGYVILFSENGEGRVLFEEEIETIVPDKDGRETPKSETGRDRRDHKSGEKADKTCSGDR